MEIETTVGRGFPVIARVTLYSPARPWRQHVFPGAGPGDCDPPDPGELEWELLTAKGKPAPDFVYKLMSRRDEERITDELDKAIAGSERDW